MRMSVKRLHETRARNGGWFHSLGYLLYTLAAAGIALWFLFPAQSVQRLLVRALGALAPGIAWSVGTIELGLPLSMKVKGVEGYSVPDSNTPALRIDQLTVWPDWETSIRKQALWLNYQIRLGSGVLRGRLWRQEQGYTFSGMARDLQLESIPLLSNQLGRQLNGTVSAAFEGEGCPRPLESCAWKVQCTLEDGRMALVRPLLRHTELAFSQVSMLLRGKGREISITKGKLTSPLGDGWFNGSLMVMADPLQSQLKFRGGFHPQPAFFDGLEKTVALQAVQLELHDKPLPFNLSGTLRHPGIHFESLAMQMYTLEKEIQ